MRSRLRRSRVPAVAVAALALGAFAAGGEAAATTVEVVDTAGRPQVAAVTGLDGQRWWTGADGRADVPSLAMTVSRAPGDVCGGEEAIAVVGGLAHARIVVPALVRAGTQAELDDEERRLLELIAAHRAELGRTTRHAAVLDRTADWYATHLARAGRLDHCLAGSPTARAHATGFPGAVVGEALSTGGDDTAETHLGRWLGSAPHRATIESFAVGTYGIAHVGGTWVLLASGDCGAGGTIPSALHGVAGASCGWSDPGASAGAGAPGAVSTETAAPGTAISATATADPHLRVTLRRTGRRVRVVARVTTKARGRLRLTVAGRTRVVRAGAAKLDTTIRLRPGRYAVSVAFTGTAPWRSARAATSIRVR